MQIKTFFLGRFSLSLQLIKVYGQFWILIKLSLNYFEWFQIEMDCPTLPQMCTLLHYIFFLFSFVLFVLLWRNATSHKLKIQLQMPLIHTHTLTHSLIHIKENFIEYLPNVSTIAEEWKVFRWFSGKAIIFIRFLLWFIKVFENELMSRQTGTFNTIHIFNCTII